MRQMALIFFCYKEAPYAESREELGALSEGWRKYLELVEMMEEEKPHVEDKEVEKLAVLRGPAQVEESKVINIPEVPTKP